MTLQNNRNAYIGMNVETLFKNSIVDHLDLIDKIRVRFNIDGRFMNANKSGIVGEKSDVRLSFASGHFIDVNIKSYKQEIAFNQLTRTTINKFSELFNLSENEKEELIHLIIRKAHNTKTNHLFSEEYQKRWGKFFNENSKKLIQWGFSYVKSREIIALYERNNDTFRIYPMKEILNNLDSKIEFTDRGNVNIGQCISFQRKGGNGSLSKTIPKTNIEHPGNNIQLKLKVNKFVELMEGYKLGEYVI